MYKYLSCFAFIFFLARFESTAQSCNCKNTIQAVITTIENNYAGYNDKTKNRFSSYKLLKANILTKSLKAVDFNYECYTILNKYFDFFDDPHLYSYFNTKKFPEEVRKVFSEKFPIIPERKKKYRIIKNSLEDYWIDDTKKYIIKIVQTKKDNFVGYITKGDSLYWYNDQIKIEIKKEKKNGYKAKYFLRDHTQKSADVLLMKDELKIGRYARFTRMDSNTTTSESKFEFKEINTNFCYLKIPNFYVQNISKTDSLITNNKSIIESTPNLIIDVRNNGGGSNLVFSKILPYLYTNTFVREGYSLRSSKENIREYNKYYNDTTFPKNVRAAFLTILNKLNERPDTLVEIAGSTEMAFDSIYPNPKKVFLLINEKCASTTEQLIMYAKQSKKTVILGNPSAGAIDYNDINSSIILPCTFLNLSYPMSRSNRVNKNVEGNSKLKPDIILNIPDEKWIDYVIKKYE